jgi:predicted DNA-binding transcriptional regulator AlpA
LEQLLTTKEVALKVGRHYQTVYGWYKRGDLPAAFASGAVILFDPAVVDREVPRLLKNRPGRKRKAA